MNAPNTERNYVLLHVGGKYLLNVEDDPHGYGTTLAFWAKDSAEALRLTRAEAETLRDELNGDGEAEWSIRDLGKNGGAK